MIIQKMNTIYKIIELNKKKFYILKIINYKIIIEL